MAEVIVVAVEESPRSRAAVCLAQRLARALGAELLLVNVYPSSPQEAVVRPEYERFVRTQSRSTLDRLAADVGDELPRTLLVCGLAVGHVLADVAREQQALAIVVGPTFKRVRDHVALGSVAEALLVEAPCPVIVARDGHYDADTPFARVAVACGGSEDDRRLVSTGAALASRAGADLRLLAVARPGVWRRDADAGRATAEELRRAQHERLGRHLGDLATLAPQARTALLEGVPADTLIGAADAAAADLLICGARHYEPVSGRHVAGVSKALVHEAGCPVLVIPHDCVAPAAH